MYDINTFYGPNAGYVLELYERYRQNPSSVSKIVAASTLAHDIRSRGHLGAHLDPLGSEPPGDPALRTETHGIRDEDLAQLPPEVIGGHSAEGVSNALEAVGVLRAMYSGTISYEFDQVKSPDERHWLRDAVGLQLYRIQARR